MLHLTILQFRELAQRNDLFGHIYFTLMPSLFLILFNENIKKSITCFHYTNLSIEKSSQYDKTSGENSDWEHVAEKSWLVPVCSQI